MKLITKLRITALTTLVILIYMAGKTTTGESSYTYIYPDFVITVQWLNGNNYRVYINHRDKPTNENYFEAEKNSSSLRGPLMSYNYNKDSLYFHNEFNYVKKINTPNYTTFYISSDTSYCPNGDNITVMNWEEGDSMAKKNTYIRWHFDMGDFYIRARLRSKKYSNYYGEKPDLILFDRHDKTSN